jgi:hypothetical protein
LVLPFNERYEESHVAYLADRIRQVCKTQFAVDAAE